MPDADPIVISLVPQTLTVIRDVADALQSSTREVVETMVSDFLRQTLRDRLSPKLVKLADGRGAHRHEAWCRVYRAYVRWLHTPSGSNPASRMTLSEVGRFDPGFQQIVQRSRQVNGKGPGPRRGRSPDHGRGDT